MAHATPNGSSTLTERIDESGVGVEKGWTIRRSRAESRSFSQVPTSAWLGVELETAASDPGQLDDAELVEAIGGFDHMASWALARQMTLLAEFARRRPVDGTDATELAKSGGMSRYAADEIGLALRLSPGSASIRLGQAQRLGAEMSATRQAWQDGQLDLTKVRAVLDATENVPPEQATAVQDRVLGKAPTQTAGQLRVAVGKAVIAVDPDGAAKRHEKASQDRRVAVNLAQDGMATLWALLPAPDALACYEWLTRLAHGMGAEDPRGMDARRADLLGALVTGRLTVAAADTTSNTTSNTTTEPAPEGASAETAAVAETAGEVPAGRQPMPQPVNPGKPLIQVVIPYDTLIGTAEHPAELVGYGAIPAPLARQIAAEGIWKRLITDPLSGALLDYGRTTYRPPAALAEFVRTRDAQCRHPICRRRAIDSELDHTIAYAGDGGHTAEHNLYAACAKHHHLKHDAPGWTVLQHRDGRITWTTPTGHSYTSDPYDYRVDDEPDIAYVKEQLKRAAAPPPPPPPPPPITDTEPPF